MKQVKNIILSIAVVLGFTVFAFAAPVGAQTSFEEACRSEGITTGACQASENNNSGTFARNIINILLFVVGAVSVVMLILGGILYATSAGDSGQVTKAKNTIMYAVVGLVLSFLAFAIVQFVFSQFIKP